MKTYRTPGATATEWSPTGNGQEVQRMETIAGSGSSLAVPVTLSLKGETTRKGVRRVVLRTECTLPGAMLNDMYGDTTIDPKTNQVISAHVVLQVPQILAQADVAGSNANGALALIAKMLGDIEAVLSNESNTASADYSSLSGLMAKAMAGAAPLDIVSGSYGESTARS